MSSARLEYLEEKLFELRQICQDVPDALDEFIHQVLGNGAVLYESDYLSYISDKAKLMRHVLETDIIVMDSPSEEGADTEILRDALNEAETALRRMTDDRADALRRWNETALKYDDEAHARFKAEEAVRDLTAELDKAKSVIEYLTVGQKKKGALIEILTLNNQELWRDTQLMHRALNNITDTLRALID